MPRLMPLFGLVVGTLSLAMAVIAGLVWWVPFTGGVFLIVPALFGALVTFVHGAWRLAAVVACLCVCVGSAAMVLSGGPLPWPFTDALMLAPFLISLGLGVWLIPGYSRARTFIDMRQPPGWLRVIRDRAGVVVGGIGLVAALGVAMYVPILWVVESQPALIYVGDITRLLSLPFLGSLTALACGAWRTGALGAYVSVQALVIMNPFFPGSFFVREVLGFLLAGLTLAACLFWSYRRSERRTVRRP